MIFLAVNYVVTNYGSFKYPYCRRSPDDEHMDRFCRKLLYVKCIVPTAAASRSISPWRIDCGKKRIEESIPTIIQSLTDDVSACIASHCHGAKSVFNQQLLYDMAKHKSYRFRYSVCIYVEHA